jgi:multidrug efflux pump
MGLNLQDVGGDLAWMLGGNFVNRFSIQGRSYKVIPQIKRVERLTPDQLANVYVRGPNGQLVQLSTFAKLQYETQPRTLNRFNQLNSVKIQGAVQAGMEDQALKVLEDEAAKILPAGFTTDYTGESRQLRKEGNAFWTTLLLALVLIYLVLAAQFESFRDPLIILLGSVPLALTGATLFCFLGLNSINVYSQVGLVTLVGLIAKNGRSGPCLRSLLCRRSTCCWLKTTAKIASGAVNRPKERKGKREILNRRLPDRRKIRLNRAEVERLVLPAL